MVWHLHSFIVFAIIVVYGPNLILDFLPRRESHERNKFDTIFSSLLKKIFRVRRCYLFYMLFSLFQIHIREDTFTIWYLYRIFFYYKREVSSSVDRNPKASYPSIFIYFHLYFIYYALHSHVYFLVFIFALTELVFLNSLW